MSENRDTANEAAAEEPQGAIGGERLAEARRERQISVVEIAKELHLDEPKVRALERNDFETLGAPVFAKGHLRKYAQLVGVDESDVLADYHQLTRSTIVPPVVTARPRPRREMTPGPWIAVIVILIAVASAYWWLTTRPLASRVLPAEDVALPADNSVPVDSVEVPLTTTAETTTETPIDDQTDNETVEAVSPPAPSQPAEGDLRLRITYSGDCWTEISDASGRRLFFDLGRAGRTVELSGEAPFNVLFGNAENVSLEVNGADYDLSSAARRGRTARLTIAGT